MEIEKFIDKEKVQQKFRDNPLVEMYLSLLDSPKNILEKQRILSLYQKFIFMLG